MIEEGRKDGGQEFQSHVTSLDALYALIIQSFECGRNDLPLGFYASEWNG